MTWDQLPSSLCVIIRHLELKMKLPPDQRLNAYFMHRLQNVRWVTDHSLSDTTIYLRREKPLASGPWDFGEVIEHPNGTYEARLKRQCGDIAPISGTW